MSERKRKRGLVLVNTGEGRGKSTSAFGVILRMLGRKKPVVLIQFLKHETGQWGEVRALRQLGLQPIKTGDGFTWTRHRRARCTAGKRRRRSSSPMSTNLSSWMNLPTCWISAGWMSPK